MSDQQRRNSKHTRKPLKPVPLLSGVEEIKQDLEERISQGDTVYGIEILDDAVETIRKGSITFVVAEQNTGKSLVGQIIACNLAKQGKKVMICTCEMGAGLLMERQIKTLTGVSSQKIKELYAKQRDTANYILDSFIEDETYSYLRNIDICETGGAFIEDITEMLDTFPEYEYVVVDYIQRIKGLGSEYENITYASRELQTYARDTGKRIIVCSQAGRQSQSDAKYGKEKDGTRIKGKGSGSIEEDADVVITLMGIEEESGRKILVTLTKNRYGHLKNITYKYTLDERLNLRLESRSYNG
ncbi:MAG: DnaB helicase C-terminal domain-containing protein [Acetobacter sp.]|nr:DnaB helicase C-terminal domain-containing protein [Acetobacter sp.]